MLISLPFNLHPKPYLGKVVFIFSLKFHLSVMWEILSFTSKVSIYAVRGSKRKFISD